MRYEDASHTSAFQGSQPIANDDLDSLPAGSRTPATGNLISGEGTQSGSAGADVAAGAHVTAIAGKGGEDTSFSGGKLSVTGEHGKLSVDAEGNYIYQANSGVENVRDRFTYTLADNNGATDTASLIVEIGKTPVVIKADAQQIVPGPDGVVTLPPGVELSDIRVVGRNLVIDMPDGTQLIIIDGAIFVPQLVLNGVEIPSTNLAALLIGQEPQPAAGETPPSSGGNFAVPPPPLDPGVPLGDLIPPTEYTYTPPEPQEVLDTLDEEPEVGPNPDVLRDDDALQGGNAGGVGDDPDAVNVTGQLSGSGGDGDLTFAIQLTGAPAGFTYVSGGDGIVLIQQGGVTVLTVTVESDGSYSVVQNAPIDHTGENEDNVLFTINYTVTDDDGDSAAGTFTINVDDDTPVLTELVAQGGVTLDESDFSIAGFPISGNSALPVVDFTALFGADGAAAVDSTVVALTITNTNSGLKTAVGDFPITLVQIDGDTIEGHYNGSNVAFIIQLEADGTVTLTQNVPLEHLVDGPPGPAHDDSLDLGGLIALSVTITDGDGDQATGQVAIGNLLVFKDDGPDAGEPIGEPETIVLDETRPEGTDTDDGSPVASPPDGLASDTIDFSDNFSAPDFGADGAGTVTYQLLLSAPSVGSGLYALQGGDTSDADGDGYGQGAEIMLTQSGNTITGSAGGVDYFTISIDPATGVVTFTQLAAIWHPTPGDWDEIATLMTDLASDIQVQQTVTDSDGDFDTATIDIGQGVFSIQDDGPDQFEECPEDVITINQPGSEFTGDLNLPDVGEDEPGAVTFNVSDGDPVLSGGNPVVSNGVPLFYFLNDQGVLEARAGDENGPVIFTITINGDGTFTYEQFGTIGDSGEISFTDLTSSAAGNVDYRAVGEDDAATTVDLILSGSDSGGADQGVNTDSDSIGVDNQSMDAGETLRVDFVSNLQTAAVAAGTPMGLTYDNHVDTNTYLQTIPQVQGSQTNEVAFQVWALDTSDTQADEPDRDPTGGFNNSNIVTITSVTVIGFDVGEGSPVTMDISAIAVGVWTDVAYGISVQKQADGSVIFTGVQEGDQYGVSTDANTFNALAVQAEPEGTGPVGNESNEDSFDLGVFSIGTDANIEPVDLTIPISLTDADGDPVVCDIDIHLGPPVNVDDVTVTVNEAGLDLVGSDPGSDSEFFLNGDLSGQVSGGTPPYTFALAPGESATGTYGTLTLNPDGTFSYELETPFDSQPDADDGTNPELAADSFQVVATDDEGNTQTLTINVNIIDDVPTAVDDTDEVVEGGTTSGNVLTGDGGDGNPAGEDTPGADGFAPDAVVGVVDGNNDAVDTDNPATVGVGIPGTYGTLTLNADGTYDYEADPNTNPPPGAVDEFVYTVVDGDGDLHSAVLTITVIDDLVPDVPENTNVGLDDDAVSGANGNPGTALVNDDPDSVNTSGSVAAVGGDGTITYALSESGAPVGFTYDLQGNGDLWISQGTTHVLTVTLDASGNYTVSQVAPILHEEGDLENNQSFTVTFRATDEDGDFDDGTLTVSVDDDTPLAYNDTDTVAAGTASGNVISGVGTTEGAANADSPGADGFDGITQLVGFNGSTDNSGPSFDVNGEFGTLTMDANGTYTYTRTDGLGGGEDDVFTYTYVDGDGDTVSATLTISIPDSTPDVPENTNVGLDDDALTGGNPGTALVNDDPDSVNTSGSVAAVGGDGTITYALSESGAPAGFTYDLQGNGDLWVLQGTTHVLTVTLDASGNYTVSQVAPILHEEGNLENNTIFTVTFRATDLDGDFDEGTLTIDVDDDSPVNFNPVGLTDKTGATPTLLDDALVNDGTANVIRFLNDANANPANGENFIGADGFGNLVFTATGHTDGEALESTGGTPLTSGTDPIYLFGFGTGVLTATTSSDNSDPGAVVFTVTLTEGAGYGSASTYEIEFFQPIDDGSGFVFDDFSSAPAGQNDWVGLDADGFDINDPDDPVDNSEDLLLTPTNVGGSINTSATDIGNSNQWIDDGEGVRIDYVIDVRRDPGSDEKDVGGYAFDGHYNVTDSSFTIMQTQGGGTASVRITAYNDSDSPPLDTLSTTNIVPIDPASIVVIGQAAGTYDVVLMADGSVVVTGLEPGSSVEFEAVGDVFFNSYSITNADGVANPEGGTFTSDAFAIGVFGFNSETAGTPIDMSFDVTAEDADGDTATGTIDVSLVPDDGSSSLTTLAATSESSTDTSSFSLLASDSQEQQVQKAAANSNTLTLAAAVAAAGMAESAAAAGHSDFGRSHNNGETEFAHGNVGRVAGSDSGDNSGQAAISGLTMDAANDSAPAEASSSSPAPAESDHVLDDSSASAAAQSSDVPAAANDQAPAPAEASPVAMSVGMPSAEALQAAGVADDAKQDGSVEQVVADALGQGNAPAAVDALLDALPGGNGALAALAHVASPAAGDVSAWDMAASGAFGHAADMVMNVHAMQHHDAVQPVVNG